jgi:cell division initiation protein
MKITPLEIRQKSFEKNFRGYDKDEVDAFLNTLSLEWERVLDEQKDLRSRLENSEKEVSKLREVESSLYKTLKTAEDTGANVVEQAKKTAELQIREAGLQAESILAAALARAKAMQDEALAATKSSLAEAEEQLKKIIQDYKTLVVYRDDLLAEMKRIGGDLQERAERVKASSKPFDPDNHMAQARKEFSRAVAPQEEKAPSTSPQTAAKVPAPTVSFFDTIS